MALTPFQIRLARLFLSMPEAQGFALAGGAALIFRRIVPRSTSDLDFFASDRHQIPAAAAALRERLEAEGLPYDVVLSSPGFVRLVVRSEDGEELRLDMGFDFRLHPPEATDLGPTLTPQELAADKLLALFGRAEARDFVDVYLLAQRFGVEPMLEWARQKDAGFDLYVLATMLGKFDAVPRREFDVDEGTYEEIRDFFTSLRADLIKRSLEGREGDP